MLKEVYRIECLFRTQGFEWFKRFKEGRETIEDNPRIGWPSTSKTDENIEKIAIQTYYNTQEIELQPDQYQLPIGATTVYQQQQQQPAYRSFTAEQLNRLSKAGNGGSGGWRHRVNHWRIQPLQPIVAEDEQASVITSTSQQTRYRQDADDEDGSNNPPSNS
ncbi:hypothetical protein NQ318_014323 [Aromia moschata]|uniref:Uncharacterized protein n=1 Tax=Aromia moschata TaxID=1265417 RepID=A0AAV8YZ34_9CUCU|nr:hypothetical protein NQ318_014323 [Aromia moschata]